MFVNTAAVWVNTLLLGASGPIRTPVGACATSLQSVDTGYDLIMTGKAKAVLVWGTDDFDKDTALEFSNMQATIDADEAGVPAKQASRPRPAAGPASSRARAAASSCPPRRARPCPWASPSTESAR